MICLFGKITDYFWHIALPVTAMTVGGLPHHHAHQELRAGGNPQQYVMTARAKGSRSARCYGARVPQRPDPIMTGFPAAFAGVLHGSLLIERCSPGRASGSFPMIGDPRDYPVVFGSLFVFTIIVSFASHPRLELRLGHPRVRFFD